MLNVAKVKCVPVTRPIQTLVHTSAYCYKLTCVEIYPYAYFISLCSTVIEFFMLLLKPTFISPPTRMNALCKFRHYYGITSRVVIV